MHAEALSDLRKWAKTMHRLSSSDLSSDYQSLTEFDSLPQKTLEPGLLFPIDKPSIIQSSWIISNMTEGRRTALDIKQGNFDTPCVQR